MSKTIERYESDINQWSPEDFLNHTQRGVKPERAEYTEARKKALERANLEDTDADAPVAIGDMSPEQHLKRLQSR